MSSLSWRSGSTEVPSILVQAPAAPMRLLRAVLLLLLLVELLLLQHPPPHLIPKAARPLIAPAALPALPQALPPALPVQPLTHLSKILLLARSCWVTSHLYIILLTCCRYCPAQCFDWLVGVLSRRCVSLLRGTKNPPVHTPEFGFIY